ncbi:hypothetical protein LTR37_000570 [Vermiconidia calcicola]|uniref:Uncharacterized protein n=1 Tax=Vermiconidia calcicola TaxID=1690605 RepID=A0ACC3NXU6_9PEZI|nr:hypothetical protein LTR37_000570 [Vermiconidia calcicola]
MSDSSGPTEKNTLEDGSVAGHGSGNAVTDAEVAKSSEEDVRNDGAKAEPKIEMVDVEAVTTSLDERSDGPGKSESREDASVSEPLEPQGKDVRSPRAEDIEKEASEHLARRAAEMTVDDSKDRSQPEAQAEDSNNKEELPQSPPAPPVPEKDRPSPTPQSDTEYDEKHPQTHEESGVEVPEAPGGTTEATGAEIQTIMDQFRNGTGGPGADEIMSPRLEKQQPMLVLPPRTSSLEHREQHGLSPQTTGGSVSSQPFSAEKQGKPPSLSGGSLHRARTDDMESVTSVRSNSIFQPPPPSPDPEPALPFDFHRFLEQLRHRTADPVARFLRSFLSEFGKKQWMVHEQVKIISDFLEFIAKKMSQCEVWRTVSDAEFDNAREGMEKLVMNRLYSQTFSPAIPSMLGSPRKAGKGGRSAADMANPHGPGRRGQHQEDVERDDVIAQKMRIYGWIREEHLDIAPINEKGRKFLVLAQQELLKINTYRAPRDKVICVLNTCKVIFGFLRNSKGDQSADSFVPLLIFTVLRARPEHLVSNVQYIWRFRNQDKLGGEAGYYMSSLMGAVTFIENLDRTTITITDEEFEQNVEQAVSAIAEKNKADEYGEKSHGTAPTMQRLNEKSTLSRPEITPKNSMDAERSSPRRSVNRERSQHAHHNSTDTVDDFDAVTGLLRTIQKPLSSIGRIFSDDGNAEKQQNTSFRPASTPLPGSTPRALSPNRALERRPSEGRRSQERQGVERQNAAADAAARQASAEAAQAQRVRAREYKVVVETLQSMFPNLDQEVIEDVVRAQEGNVGRAVDACLALSNG